MVEFITSSIPEALQMYCIVVHSNQAIEIHTEKGEYESTPPKSLPQFLSKANTGWYAKTETPFSSSKQIGQTSLEMELNRDYLLLKDFKTDQGQLYLLINLKPFGLSKTKYLLAGEKKLLEHCINGIALKLIEQTKNDKTILKNIALSNAQSRNEINQVKQQLDYQNKNFEVAITQFIQLIVTKLQSKYGIQIRLSKEFIQALKTYNKPFENLEENLEQHILIELNLAIAQDEHEIVLKPSHLQSLQQVVRQTTENNSDLNLGRFAKTYKLLDRYEQAAELVLQKNLKVIGKNIGTHCKPAVSNASITDALNKHAKKIFELFKRYPDQWNIIRSEFRSVANIIEKESVRRQQIA
jgi:hypothetical protein